MSDYNLEQPHALPHVPTETVYMTPTQSELVTVLADNKLRDGAPETHCNPKCNRMSEDIKSTAQSPLSAKDGSTGFACHGECKMKVNESCQEPSPQGYRCTRLVGHTGQHVACCCNEHAVDCWPTTTQAQTRHENLTTTRDFSAN